MSPVSRCLSMQAEPIKLAKAIGCDDGPLESA
jgi:hypothetical protein